MAIFRRRPGVDVTCPVCRVRSSNVRPRRIKPGLDATGYGMHGAGGDTGPVLETTPEIRPRKGFSVFTCPACGYQWSAEPSPPD